MSLKNCMSVPSTGLVKNITNWGFIGLQTNMLASTVVLYHHRFHSEAEVHLHNNHLLMSLKPKQKCVPEIAALEVVVWKVCVGGWGVELHVHLFIKGVNLDNKMNSFKRQLKYCISSQVVFMVFTFFSIQLNYTTEYVEEALPFFCITTAAIMNSLFIWYKASGAGDWVQNQLSVTVLNTAELEPINTGMFTGKIPCPDVTAVMLIADEGEGYVGFGVVVA